MSTNSTYRSGDITRAIQDLAELNRAALKLEYIGYGETVQIPDTPALIIEPGNKARKWGGTMAMTDNVFTIIMALYHTGLDDTDQIQRDVDTITEDWEEILNTASVPVFGGDQLGGLIISGMVTLIDYGYTIREDRRLRANRMTYTCTSKTRLVNTE